MKNCGKIEEKFGKLHSNTGEIGLFFDFLLNYLLKNDKSLKISLKIDKENFFSEKKNATFTIT